MTIPEKPLELNDFDVNKLTLGEMSLFDTEDIGIGTFNKLRKFLIAHSSWTKEEVEKIEMGELQLISEQLSEAIRSKDRPFSELAELKDWARINDKATPPLWVAYYRYAEKFGCHPQDVPKVVTIKAFYRWLILEKVDQSRDVWERWENADTKPTLNKKEKELKDWAMNKKKGY